MILINAAIYSILGASEKLAEQMDIENLYPVVAPDYTEKHCPTRFPFIVYTRSLSAEYSCDGWELDNCGVTVSVYSDSYFQGCQIAETVRKELDGIKGEFSGMVIRDCRVDDINEAFEEGAFIQDLEFQIKTE